MPRPGDGRNVSRAAFVARCPRKPPPYWHAEPEELRSPAASRRTARHGMRPQRKIIHIDMDAFYASVEQRDNPALRGKPIAVGRARERGMVAAASYEARKFGVHSALASVIAKRKCPDLVFVPPRFDVYKAVSRQIHAIFAGAKSRDRNAAWQTEHPFQCRKKEL